MIFDLFCIPKNSFLIGLLTTPLVKLCISAAKDEAAQILFGERGILTGIFRMMDQQRKVQMAPQHDISVAADNGKIGEDILDKTCFHLTQA